MARVKEPADDSGTHGAEPDEGDVHLSQFGGQITIGAA
jgi:hypothetical protein